LSPQQAETFGSFIARRRDRLYQTNRRPAIAVLGRAQGFAWRSPLLYASAKPPPCRIAVLMGAFDAFRQGIANHHHYGNQRIRWAVRSIRPVLTTTPPQSSAREF